MPLKLLDGVVDRYICGGDVRADEFHAATHRQMMFNR
jgi:hypothetical protein